MVINAGVGVMLCAGNFALLLPEVVSFLLVLLLLNWFQPLLVILLDRMQLLVRNGFDPTATFQLYCNPTEGRCGCSRTCYHHAMLAVE